MSDTFSIQIDQHDLRKIEEMFSDIGKSPAKVFVRSLNKTLTGVKTDASTAIRGVVTAKKADVDKTFSISKASEKTLSASITCTGKRLPLYTYSARQTKKGVSVQVKRANPRTVVPHAFVAKMKSRHVGVWVRDYVPRGKSGRTVSADPQIRYGRLPRQYRLPIRELFSMRVPDVMGYEPTMKTILKQAENRLQKNLMHEMEYELSKHK